MRMNLHPLTLVRDHAMLTDKAETLFEEVQQVSPLPYICMYIYMGTYIYRYRYNKKICVFVYTYMNIYL